MPAGDPKFGWGWPGIWVFPSEPASTTSTYASTTSTVAPEEIAVRFSATCQADVERRAAKWLEACGWKCTKPESEK